MGQTLFCERRTVTATLSSNVNVINFSASESSETHDVRVIDRSNDEVTINRTVGLIIASYSPFMGILADGLHS